VTRSHAAVVAALLCMPLALAGQAGTSSTLANPQSASAQVQAAAPAVSFHAQANLVLVDAVVTSNGAVVSGLGKDKFQLFQDGKPQEIRIFEEHKPEEKIISNSNNDLPAHTYSDIPQFSISSAANVLLLDALNTPLSDQMYVRQQMLKYLKNIPPGTRIAVFTLASRLRIVEGFTTDSGVIAKALSGKGGPQQSSLLDNATDQELSDSTNDMGSLGASADAVSAMQQFQADFTSYQTDVRVQNTLEAMQQLARYLSVIPGRKNLIWFSGSFPLSIDPDATLTDEFSVLRNYSEQVRETDNMLSSARVAVYPVDARGLMSLPSTNAANSFSSAAPGASMGGGGSRRRGRGGMPSAVSPGGGSRSGSSQPAAAAADQKFLAQTIQEHDSMRQIAEETGGEAFVDTNGLKDAVARAIANGSHYYTIGYVPSIEKYDGLFHRIRLNVDGGYTADYRRGFYADDPAKSAVNTHAALDAMNGAVTRGAPPLADILFKVRVLPADDPSAKDVKLAPGLAGEAKGLKGPVKRYLIDYAVDAHPFMFTDTPDGVHHARVEFAVIAYDRDGRRLNWNDRAMGYSLNAAMLDQIMRSGVHMHQEIDLPAGSIYLRVVVHDLDSTKVGSTEVPIVVGKP
jgi:VWFA-related protein